MQRHVKTSQCFNSNLNVIMSLKRRSASQISINRLPNCLYFKKKMVKNKKTNVVRVNLTHLTLKGSLRNKAKYGQYEENFPWHITRLD